MEFAMLERWWITLLYDASATRRIAAVYYLKRYVTRKIFGSYEAITDPFFVVENSSDILRVRLLCVILDFFVRYPDSICDAEELTQCDFSKVTSRRSTPTHKKRRYSRKVLRSRCGWATVSSPCFKQRVTSSKKTTPTVSSSADASSDSGASATSKESWPLWCPSANVHPSSFQAVTDEKTMALSGRQESAWYFDHHQDTEDIYLYHFIKRGFPYFLFMEVEHFCLRYQQLWIASLSLSNNYDQNVDTTQRRRVSEIPFEEYCNRRAKQERRRMSCNSAANQRMQYQSRVQFRNPFRVRRVLRSTTAGDVSIGHRKTREVSKDNGKRRNSTLRRISRQLHCRRAPSISRLKAPTNGTSALPLHIIRSPSLCLRLHCLLTLTSLAVQCSFPLNCPLEFFHLCDTLSHLVRDGFSYSENSHKVFEAWIPWYQTSRLLAFAATECLIELESHYPLLLGTWLPLDASYCSARETAERQLYYLYNSSSKETILRCLEASYGYAPRADKENKQTLYSLYMSSKDPYAEHLIALFLFVLRSSLSISNGDRCIYKSDDQQERRNATGHWDPDILGHYVPYFASRSTSGYIKEELSLILSRFGGLYRTTATTELLIKLAPAHCRMLNEITLAPTCSWPLTSAEPLIFIAHDSATPCNIRLASLALIYSYFHVAYRRLSKEKNAFVAFQESFCRDVRLHSNALHDTIEIFVLKLRLSLAWLSPSSRTKNSRVMFQYCRTVHAHLHVISVLALGFFHILKSQETHQHDDPVLSTFFSWLFPSSPFLRGTPLSLNHASQETAALREDAKFAPADAMRLRTTCATAVSSQHYYPLNSAAKLITLTVQFLWQLAVRYPRYFLNCRMAKTLVALYFLDPPHFSRYLVTWIQETTKRNDCQHSTVSFYTVRLTVIQQCVRILRFVCRSESASVPTHLSLMQLLIVCHPEHALLPLFPELLDVTRKQLLQEQQQQLHSSTDAPGNRGLWLSRQLLRTLQKVLLRFCHKQKPFYVTMLPGIDAYEGSLLTLLIAQYPFLRPLSSFLKALTREPFPNSVRNDVVRWLEQELLRLVFAFGKHYERPEAAFPPVTLLSNGKEEWQQATRNNINDDDYSVITRNKEQLHAVTPDFEETLKETLSLYSVAPAVPVVVYGVGHDSVTKDQLRQLFSYCPARAEDYSWITRVIPFLTLTKYTKIREERLKLFDGGAALFTDAFDKASQQQPSMLNDEAVDTLSEYLKAHCVQDISHPGGPFPTPHIHVPIRLEFCSSQTEQTSSTANHQETAIANTAYFPSKLFALEIIFSLSPHYRPIKSTEIPFLASPCDISEKASCDDGCRDPPPVTEHCSILSLSIIRPLPTTINAFVNFQDAQGTLYFGRLQPITLNLQDYFLPVKLPWRLRPLLFSCLNNPSQYNSLLSSDFSGCPFKSVRVLDVEQELLLLQLDRELAPFATEPWDDPTFKPFMIEKQTQSDTEPMQEELFDYQSTPYDFIHKLHAPADEEPLDTLEDLVKGIQDTENTTFHNTGPPTSLVADASVSIFDIFVSCSTREKQQTLSYKTPRIETIHKRRMVIFVPPSSHLLLEFSVGKNVTVVRMATSSLELLQSTETFLRRFSSRH